MALEGSQGTDENGFRMKGCEIILVAMAWQTRTGSWRGNGTEGRDEGNTDRVDMRPSISSLFGIFEDDVELGMSALACGGNGVRRRSLPLLR